MLGCGPQITEKSMTHFPARQLSPSMQATWETSLSDAALTSSISWKRRQLEELQLSHLAHGCTGSFFPHHWQWSAFQLQCSPGMTCGSQHLLPLWSSSADQYHAGSTLWCFPKGPFSATHVGLRGSWTGDVVCVTGFSSQIVFQEHVSPHPPYYPNQPCLHVSLCARRRD